MFFCVRVFFRKRKKKDPKTNFSNLLQVRSSLRLKSSSASMWQMTSLTSPKQIKINSIQQRPKSVPQLVDCSEIDGPAVITTIEQWSDAIPILTGLKIDALRLENAISPSLLAVTPVTCSLFNLCGRQTYQLSDSFTFPSFFHPSRTRIYNFEYHFNVRKNKDHLFLQRVHRSWRGCAPKRDGCRPNSCRTRGNSRRTVWANCSELFNVQKSTIP